MITKIEEENRILQDKLAKAEAIIERFNNRDRLASQVARIGYWDFNPATGDLYWSPEVLELLTGRPSDETSISYEEFFNFVHPDDREECDRIVTEAVKTNSQFFVEYRVTHHDGGIHWISGWGGPTENHDGAQRLIGAVIDITERKVLTASLMQKNHELQNALKEIKTLEGIIPICSHCKKIRTDEGFWTQVEKYIEDHSDARFSHGMCESCAHEIYGEEPWYKQINHNKQR